MTAYQSGSAKFEGMDAQVLAISTDGVHCHQAFIEFVLGQINFPLASDTTFAVSRAYGVLRENDGLAQRALFIIDPAGVVRYEVVHDLDTGRSVEEVSRVLQALATDAACGADWHPGVPGLLATR